MQRSPHTSLLLHFMPEAKIIPHLGLQGISMLCSQAWGDAGLAGSLTVSEDTHSHSTLG